MVINALFVWATDDSVRHHDGLGSGRVDEREHFFCNARIVADIGTFGKPASEIRDLGVLRLPSDFPAQQLQELLAELQSLPLGTAEGCRPPLEYARGRLPAIRRQFLKTEEESRQSPTDADASPPLTRGMTIDVRIGALVNSVTTALDEYRALASVHEDDVADTAPLLEIDATSPDVVAAMAASQSAEQALDKHINELGRIAKPDSITADDLKRQLRDTRGLLSLALIELRMPAFVPRWYRPAPLAIAPTRSAVLQSPPPALR